MRFLFRSFKMRRSSQTGLKKATTLQTMIQSILFIKYEIFFHHLIVCTHMFLFFLQVQYQYTKGLIFKVMLSRLGVLKHTETFPCSNTCLKNTFWKPSKPLFCQIYFLFSSFSFSSNKLCVCSEGCAVVSDDLVAGLSPVWPYSVSRSVVSTWATLFSGGTSCRKASGFRLTTSTLDPFFYERGWENLKCSGFV